MPKKIQDQYSSCPKSTRYYYQHKEKVTAYNKKYYQAHREAYKRSCLKGYQKRRELVNRIKARPCEDCRIQYNPWVMQFDHRDPNTKQYKLAKVTHLSLPKLFAEISKCDVVCANCHTERTHKQSVAGLIKRNI